MGTELLQTLLSDKINDLTAQRSVNPLEELFHNVSVYEELKNKFKPDRSDIPTTKSQYELEALKIKLQDEREREFEMKKFEVEQERNKTLKYAINTVGTELVDVLGAFASALNQRNQQNQMPPQQNQMPPAGVQGTVYHCDQCNQDFILTKGVSNPTCPYCGHKEQSQGGQTHAI